MKKILTKLFCCCISLFLANTILASVPITNNFSLDLQNVSLQQAIYILAKFIHKNVVISPRVSGMTTVHLHKVSANESFKLLLMSHDLVEQRMGNISYIMSRAEMIKHQQDQIQLQEVADDVMPVTVQTWHMHYARAVDVARLIQDGQGSLLSKRGHVRVDSRTNILCVQDTLSNLCKIKNLVNHLDIPVQQVLIATRLASVDHDYVRELGIQFGGEISKNSFSIAIARLADGTTLDVRLAAMESEGHGELISCPSLFTSNQKLASIESGEEIPYQETSKNGATSVVFKKAVLSLKVIPQIMPNNNVLLQLQINQDRPNSREVLGVPAITTRQIRSSVLVKNGQTIVLGGIYESNRENNQERLPFFGKIPLIGLIFQRQNIIENKRELLIFVTPNIVSD